MAARDKRGTTETQEKRRHNEEWREPFLEHVRSGSSITASALAAGVGRATVYRTLETDTSLAEELKDAWEHGTDLMEDMLRQDACKDGAFIPKLAILKARRPDRWRERAEVQHSGHMLIWDLPGPTQTLPTSSEPSGADAAG